MTDILGSVHKFGMKSSSSSVAQRNDPQPMDHAFDPYYGQQQDPTFTHSQVPQQLMSTAQSQVNQPMQSGYQLPMDPTQAQSPQSNQPVALQPQSQMQTQSLPTQPEQQPQPAQKHPTATFQPFSTNPAFGVPGGPGGPSTPGALGAAPMQSAKPRNFRNNIILMGLATAALIALGVIVFENCYNFDIWYMLATGREILENGIPYENPFSQHEGTQIIVQQWLLCVIYYLIYQPFGMVGIATLIMVVSALVMVSAYRLGRLKKDDRFGGEIIAILCIPLLLALQIYMKMGSSPFSMLVFIWIMFLCEKYRRTGKFLWLLPLAPIALVHVQIHMAFVPFDLLIIFCYLIPNFPGMVARSKAKRKAKHDSIIQQVGIQQNASMQHVPIAFALSDYRRLPLLIALIVYAALLLVNPYGLRGAIYFLLSYGAADYGMAIPEMIPTTIGILGINGPCVLAMILLGYMALAKRGLKSIDLPVTLLFLITTVMTFQHTRNCWLAPLFGFVLICGTIHGWSWSKAGIKAFFRGEHANRYEHSEDAASAGAANAKDGHASIFQRVIAIVLIVAATAFTCVFSVIDIAPRMAKMEQTDDYTPGTFLETVVNSSENDEDLKIFNPIRLGGYLEWLGIKPYIDSRVEVWNEPISGEDRDYYYEYVDMMNNDWPFDHYQIFLEDNDFDYIITEDDSTLESYMSSYAQGYKRLKGDGQFSLWKKDASVNYAHDYFEDDPEEEAAE